MFPSPQDRVLLNEFRRELQSGVSPKQFGLETMRYYEFIDHASAYRTTQVRPRLPNWRLLRSTLINWLENVRPNMTAISSRSGARSV